MHELLVAVLLTQAHIWTSLLPRILPSVVVPPDLVLQVTKAEVKAWELSALLKVPEGGQLKASLY